MISENNTYEIQDIFEGSLHYISGKTAHGLINMSKNKLSVGACWQSELEYDYICYFPIRVTENGDDEIEYVNCST